MAIVAVICASVLGTFSALVSLMFGAPFDHAFDVYLAVSLIGSGVLILIGMCRQNFSAVICRSAENSCPTGSDLRYGKSY